MSQTDLVKKILTAKKLEDIIDIRDFKNSYNQIIREIHPDRCPVPEASEATSKVNGWKEFYNEGKSYKDDVGAYTSNGYWVKFDSSLEPVKWSLENYNILESKKSSADEVFKKYIPQCRLTGFTLGFRQRAIPLSGLVLPQEHVNWVLNRLLEYIAYLAQIGMSHCGFNPESVFITPEDHGIQVASFYHMTAIGNKIGTISGKYQNWYPQDVFRNKKATQAIDIQLVKSIAIYLLGDTSGSGTKLRKTHNEEYVNFLLTSHDNAFDALSIYKELLTKNFKKEFHKLDL